MVIHTGRHLPQRVNKGAKMCSERIWWLFVALVEATLFLGAFLVVLLPDRAQPIGWAVITRLAAVAAVLGSPLVSLRGEHDKRRYIWSMAG